MHVEISLDLLLEECSWQLPLAGGLDLARVFAHGWGNEREIERPVDLLLSARRDALSGPLHRERVLVERPAPINGQLAQLDVVGLAAGEVDERRSVVLRAHIAEVHLQSARSDDGGLRVA